MGLTYITTTLQNSMGVDLEKSISSKEAGHLVQSQLIWHRFQCNPGQVGDLFTVHLFFSDASM